MLPFGTIHCFITKHCHPAINLTVIPKDHSFDWICHFPPYWE